MTISQTRPRAVAATVPIAFWRLPFGQFAADAARGEHLDAPLREPGGGGHRVAEQGQPTEHEHGEGGGEHQEIDMLGRRHNVKKAARLRGSGRTSDYIRKGRRSAF